MDNRYAIGLFLAAALVVLTSVAALRAKVPAQSGAVDPNRRALVRLGGVLGLGFAGLVVRLTSITVLNASSTADRVGQAPDGETLSNPRRIALQVDARRGRILDRNGEVLARSDRRNGDWERSYSAPEAAHLLGYFSPLRFGTAGVEHSRDGSLTGAEPLTLGEAWDTGILARPPAGHDVRLTIDLELQRLARELLADTTGSAILLDQRTGRVLAMASSPAYDPNDLVAVSEDQIADVDQVWNQLQNNDDRPLLFRATSGLYPPGSTFKALVAASAIDARAVTPETVFTDDGSLDVNGRVFPEYNRPDETKTEWTVDEGIIWSLNVVFAQVGMQLGSDRLTEYAALFGIGRAVEFELPTASGQLASRDDALQDPASLAATSFGQGELLVTPLHMAMVMSAIANGGVAMRPLLVDAVLDDAGDPVTSSRPSVARTPISSESAATALGLLYDSVTYGYASGAQITDLRVAAKTGTAESGREAPHGWFIGSAGVNEPVVTVAVCLDFGGEGGGRALQIGRALLDAAIAR